jgi:hypothetical protein
VFVIAACQTISPPSASLAPCDAASRLVDNPGWGPVAKAGPLGMRAFDEGSKTALIQWSPGTMTKVLIGQIEPSAAFSVRGAHCVDGVALRFWYRGGVPFVAGPTSTPVPSAVFAVTGDTGVDFDADPNVSPPERMNFKTGYMLFSEPGLWRIEVLSGDHLLGSAVLEVRNF